MRCPSSLTFHTFDFSCCHVVFFGFFFGRRGFFSYDWVKSLPFYLKPLSFHFTAEFNFVFSGRLEKQDGRASHWLAEKFSTPPLKPLNRVQRNLTGSKIWLTSAKFEFFGPIEKKSRWPPRPIGWDILDFSSATAERNSTKLDRKQVLNVLYEACVFGADQKNNKAAQPLIGFDIFAFRLLLRNLWTKFIKTWQKARSQRPIPSACFWPISKQKWPPWSICPKDSILYSDAW